MGRRCGCVGKDCNCAIYAGRGVEISGEGDQTNPLVLTQSATAYLRPASTDETEVLLTGTGTSEDPYVLGMDFVGTPDSKPLSVTDYITPGMHGWLRPVGCSMIEVTAIGGGAGGDAGRNPTGGLNYGFGGSGGQGGGWSKKVFLLPGYVTDCTISVGAGGAGGVGAEAGGNYGQDSWLRVNSNPGMWVVALGGAPATFAPKGWGIQRGAIGPTSTTDPNLSVLVPAGGGGGKGANGNQDIEGSISGGMHVAYLDPPSLAYGGDGGRGGRAFQGGASVVPGHAIGGYFPGGGGGGGRGGVSGYPQPGGGTVTFIPSNGGAGANGMVRVVAY